MPPAPRPAPENLHPALWRASQLGAGRAAVTPSGFAALDAQLPGGGWPHRVLTELLLPHPGLGELRLLAPALLRWAGAGAAAAGRGPDACCVMLFNPPAMLCGWGLSQLGLDAQQWLIVQGRGMPGRGGADQPPLHPPSQPPSHHPAHHPAHHRPGPGADVLWALEQALRSGHLGAALAWLPGGCKADVLRRLQLAAQAHDGPVFIFRELQASSRPSVAPLRLVLAPAGIDVLALRVLKRRGPALAQPLHLALPPVLGSRQRDRARVAGPTRGLPSVGASAGASAVASPAVSAAPAVGRQAVSVSRAWI